MLLDLIIGLYFGGGMFIFVVFLVLYWGSVAGFRLPFLGSGFFLVG